MRGSVRTYTRTVGERWSAFHGGEGGDARPGSVSADAAVVGRSAGWEWKRTAIAAHVCIAVDQSQRMSVPVAVVAARVAVVLLDDILEWAIRIGLAALLLLLIPLSGVVVGFGGILALLGGLSGTADGGGP